MRQGAAEQTNSRRIVIIFLVAAIALLVVGPKIEPVASILSPVFAPVDSVASGISDDLSGAVSSLTNLPRLQGEIKALRRQNAILIKKDGMDPIYRRENAALSRELNFRDLNPHLELQPARIIGESLVGLGNAVTIGVGSNQGLRVGNPVFDPNGFVVGKITRVWESAATVGLISSGDVAIPAMDSATGTEGLVDTPYGGSPRLDDVQTGRPINSGDLVVTSGLGNEFPIGSYIGQITRVHISNVQAFQYAPIHTAADLNDLQYVQVVLNFGPGIRVNYTKSVKRNLP